MNRFVKVIQCRGDLSLTEDDEEIGEVYEDGDAYYDVSEYCKQNKIDVQIVDSCLDYDDGESIGYIVEVSGSEEELSKLPDYI